MDASRFDTLARAFVTASSRRGLLRLLASLPLVGGLAAFLDLDDEVVAKGRRKRRKKAHKHGKGRRRKHHKGTCKPKSLAKTCAGKCGLVKNNCKQTVDCGPCACDPPCGDCFTCNETTKLCEVDPDQVGDPCGEPGQICQADGSCACDDDSCPACTTCGGEGTCQGCSGCCDGDVCVAACGDCQVCDGEGQCAPCPGCCDGTICVAACPACEACDGGHCASCASLGQLCCDAICVDGTCCEDSECPDAGAPDCVAHDCVCAANGNTACASGETCCDDGCADLDSDPDHCGDCATACPSGQVCQGGVCGFSCGGNFCPAATEICDGGTCQACTVCATCPQTTVQEAIDAASNNATIRICAGTYGRVGSNPVASISGKNLLMAGAGTGVGGTILDGSNAPSLFDPVLTVLQSTSIVRHLTVTGATNGPGIIISSPAELTLAGVTVIDNHNPASANGGGIHNNDRLTLEAGTSVTANSASRGGGITNRGAGAVLTVKAGASIIGNTANSTGGGIYDPDGGTVTLEAGSLVCNNSEPQCFGFPPPSGFCGACP